MKSKILPVLTYFGFFLVSSGLSYFIFSKLIVVKTKNTPDSSVSTENTPVPKRPGIITFSGPKTEACPINGALYTKEEKDLWSARRPLTVMIENHADSRPQSGLNNADIVYEAVAEGGITRFMAVYYCKVLQGAENKYDVGPVRSARTYFLDLASEYSDYPLYAHVGGANCSGPKLPDGGTGPCTTNIKAQAIEQIGQYGWTNKGTWSDLSQFSLSYKVCRREPERTGDVRDTEHTMYCSTKELWEVAKSRGLTNLTEINKSSWDKKFTSWSFTAQDQPAAEITTPVFSFDFWSGYKDYSVAWNYDQSTNSYLRSNGGQPHVDFNDNERITAKNIIVQYVKESRSIDPHLHNLYGLIGNGSGLIFRNGEKIEVTWSKANRTARTIFKNKNNKEVDLVPGTTWVEILPSSSSVNYENPSQP